MTQGRMQLKQYLDVVEVADAGRHLTVAYRDTVVSLLAARRDIRYKHDCTCTWFKGQMLGDT